jgi:hypothetical protein
MPPNLEFLAYAGTFGLLVAGAGANWYARHRRGRRKSRTAVSADESGQLPRSTQRMMRAPKGRPGHQVLSQPVLHRNQG